MKDQTVTDSGEIKKEQNLPAQTQEPTTVNTGATVQAPKQEDIEQNEVARRDATISDLQKKLNETNKNLKVLSRDNSQLLKKIKDSNIDFTDEGNSNENSDSTIQSERLAAEREIYRSLLSSSRFAQVLEADATLKDILTRNPLALTDNNWLDAEDAVSQIQEQLESRLTALKQAKKEEVEAQPTNPTIQPDPVSTEPIVNPSTVSDIPPEKSGGKKDIEKGIREKVTYTG